jgi:hypothetical protein
MSGCWKAGGLPASTKGFYRWTESDVLKQVVGVAVSRQERGPPLRSIELFVRDTEELFRTGRGLVDKLRGCVESVEIVGTKA